MMVCPTGHVPARAAPRVLFMTGKPRNSSLGATTRKSPSEPCSIVEQWGSAKLRTRRFCPPVVQSFPDVPFSWRALINVYTSAVPAAHAGVPGARAIAAGSRAVP